VMSGQERTQRQISWGEKIVITVFVESSDCVRA
jgi:hypothetical protein